MAEEVQQFYDLESVEPALTDGLLLARERLPKITTLGQLQQLMVGAISFSQTPPDKGYLWGQLDGDDNLIELWQRRGAHWLSEMLYPISAYRGSVSGSTTRYPAVPVLGAQLWIEDMTVQGLNLRALASGERYDFQLRVINAQSQQTPLFYLRLEGASANQTFRLSEPVGLMVAGDDALTIAFRAQRTGTRPRLRLLTMSARLRRVYDDAENN